MHFSRGLILEIFVLKGFQLTLHAKTSMPDLHIGTMETIMHIGTMETIMHIGTMETIIHIGTMETIIINVENSVVKCLNRIISPFILKSIRFVF